MGYIACMFNILWWAVRAGLLALGALFGALALVSLLGGWGLLVAAVAALLWAAHTARGLHSAIADLVRALGGR